MFSLASHAGGVREDVAHSGTTEAMKWIPHTKLALTLLTDTPEHRNIECTHTTFDAHRYTTIQRQVGRCKNGR